MEEIQHPPPRVRSPRTNGFVERMNRTLLDKCIRVKGRTEWYLSPAEIQRDLDAYLEEYNVRRTHQGYRVRGRTPAQVLRGALGIETHAPVRLDRGGAYRLRTGRRLARCPEARASEITEPAQSARGLGGLLPLLPRCYQPRPNQAQRKSLLVVAASARFPVLCCAWIVLVQVGEPLGTSYELPPGSTSSTHQHATCGILANRRPEVAGDARYVLVFRDHPVTRAGLGGCQLEAMSSAAHGLIEETLAFPRMRARNCWRRSSRASTDPPRPRTR